MILVLLAIVLVFIIYSLSGVATANVAATTPLGDTTVPLGAANAEFYQILNTTIDNSPIDIGGNLITSDESTWPSGDRVWNVCRAIARAEGANIAGSNPDRLNNPGDISDGFNQYGGENHSGSNITKFPDKETGWKWLYSKITNAFVNGASTVYSPAMTWNDFAKKYAGNWQVWVNNVTGSLGVYPTETVGSYFA